MKFKLNEARSDIVSIAKECVAAADESQGLRGLPISVRDTLGRAAQMLNECKSLMEHSVQELESAVALRAGLNDTMSRHDEINRTKNRAMEHVADIFRRQLEQFTPRDEPKSGKAPGRSPSVPSDPTPPPSSAGGSLPNTPATSDEVI